MPKYASRLLGATALAAAAVSATPAEAQRVNRIVAFGDSYADDGNLFELLGIPRPASYPNGRFSNNTNFVDTMGLLLGRPIDNFAIGGAFTGNGNINGPGIPGFVTEYQSFLAGGGSAAFPRTTGRFGANDLLVISIGGNDARAYRLGGGTVAGAATAAAPRVTETQTGLNALVGAGARNITFLAGDVGRLPEAVGQPSAAAGSAYSTAFNQGMRTVLAGYANQGVVVNYLDLNLIGDRVQANLAAYGLRSAGASTAADVAAGNADQFLFYADNVHLSSAGFTIVGRYAVRQLEAPLHLEAQGETALAAAGGFGRALSGRLDLSTARTGLGSGRPWRLFLQGDYGQQSREETLASLSYRSERAGVTGGVEYDNGSFVAGLAGNWARGDVKFGTGTGGISTDSYNVGAYAGWSGGGAFVQAYGGIGRAELDVRRTAVIDEINASPEADLLTAGARAGYLFGLGPVRIGPVVGVHFSRAELGAYTETGDPVLTLNVQDQSLDRLVGSAGLEMRGSFDLSGSRVDPYLAVTVEDDFNDDVRTVRYAGTASPTIVNSWILAPRSTEAHARIAGGVAIALSGNVTLQAAGAMTAGQEGGDEGSASLAVRVGF